MFVKCGNFFNILIEQFLLQWSDKMQQMYPDNRTAQLIGEHMGKMADEIQKDLVTFMKNRSIWTRAHLAFCHTIS